MLALLSLIMDAFRIGYFVGYHSCISAVLGVYPIIHALHTISQVRTAPRVRICHALDVFRCMFQS